MVSDRYLDPDPLLLSAPHGSGNEVNSVNPRFHALNQALVQLVSDVATWHTPGTHGIDHLTPFNVCVVGVGVNIDLRINAKCCASPRCFVEPITAFSRENLAREQAPQRNS